MFLQPIQNLPCPHRLSQGYLAGCIPRPYADHIRCTARYKACYLSLRERRSISFDRCRPSISDSSTERLMVAPIESMCSERSISTP